MGGPEVRTMKGSQETCGSFCVRDQNSTHPRRSPDASLQCDELTLAPTDDGEFSANW
jgi:hypothetical protein